MRNKLLLFASLTLALATQVHAQSDTTSHIFKSGMGIYAEFGLLPNNKKIREELERLQVKPFTSFMGSIVLARRSESERWFSEGRIILMNSTNYTTDRNERKAYLHGIGIGTDGGPKLVNTSRWNVMIPLGLDLMLYRLNIKNNADATMAQLLANPAAYQAVKVRTGNINLHGGVGVDYKIKLAPKVHEMVYLSAKATYHQPLLGTRRWKGDNVTVTDLSRFKANQVYIQVGAVFFPRAGAKMWGMHH